MVCVFGRIQPKKEFSYLLWTTTNHETHLCGCCKPGSTTIPGHQPKELRTLDLLECIYVCGRLSIEGMAFTSRSVALRLASRLSNVGGKSVGSRFGRLSEFGGVEYRVNAAAFGVGLTQESSGGGHGGSSSVFGGAMMVAGAAIATVGSLGGLVSCDEAAAPVSEVGTVETKASPESGSNTMHQVSPLPFQPRSDMWSARRGLKVFSGNANVTLAQEVAVFLQTKLGKAHIGRFADGEVNCTVGENVRGKDIYIVQPTCMPVNENLMELLLMVSTMRRASARRITAVIPYYGYARQDRKMTARTPISAADVARLLEAMGVDRVVAIDLHCGQIQGFFGPRVPVDNLDGGVIGVSYFGNYDLHNPVVVSPDAGGVYRAKKFREGLAAKHDLDPGLAMIIKQRSKANEVERMDLVGNVVDSDVIIVDDIIDTAGTLCKAAEVLKEYGARRVFAFASHGLFNGPANARLAQSALTEVVVLDTIPLSEESKANTKIRQLSIAHVIAQAIQNIHTKKSVSALFK